MSFAAIFSREFRLHRSLLIGALGIGLGAALYPRLQGYEGAKAVETAMAAAVALGSITSAIAALWLGAGAMARDLRDGNLSFDLVRPISALSVWAGRFGAAIFLLIASNVLVCVPAILQGGRFEGPRNTAALLSLGELGTGGVALVGLIFAPFLLFLTHLVVMFSATRPRRLAFDLLAFLGVSLLLVTAGQRLFREGALAAFAVATLGLVAFSTLALAVSSCVQLVAGRMDLSRGLRAFSIGLWFVLFVGAVGFEMTSRWFVSPRVEDLVQVNLTRTAPTGSWVSVTGRSRQRGDHVAGILFNAEQKGRSFPLGPIIGWEPTKSFEISNNGATAVWATQAHHSDRKEFWKLSLLEPDSQPEPLDLGVESSDDRLALSSNGRWLALISSGRLLVHDLVERQRAAAIELEGFARLAWTATPGRLRVFERFHEAVDTASKRRSKVRISEVSLPEGKVVRLAETDWNRGGSFFGISRDGSTLVLSGLGHGELVLFDGDSGTQLAKIERGHLGTYFDTPALGDRTFGGVVNAAGGGQEFRQYDRRGRVLSDAALPAMSSWTAGGLATPTDLLIAGCTKPEGCLYSDANSWHLFVVDLKGRTAEPLGRGLPADHGYAGVGTLGARLVVLRDGRLGCWNPLSRRVELLGEQSRQQHLALARLVR